MAIDQLMKEQENDVPKSESKKKSKKKDVREDIKDELVMANGEDHMGIGEQPIGTPGKEKKHKKKKQIINETGGVEETLEKTPVDLSNETEYGTGIGELQEEQGQIDTKINNDGKKKKKKKNVLNEDMNEELIQENGESHAGDTETLVETPGKKKKKKKKKETNVENETMEKVEENIEVLSEELTPMEVNSKVENISELEEQKDNANQKTNTNEDKQINKGKKRKYNEDVINASSVEQNAVEPLNEESKSAKRIKTKGKGKEEKTKQIKNGEIGGFTVMGEIQSVAELKVKKVLPHWMTTPVRFRGAIQGGDNTAIESFPGIDDSIKATLAAQGINCFFPVQACVIPELLAGGSTLAARYRPRDICVTSPTGSGKTLVYALPIIQALSSRTVKRIRALVLLPTNELAKQVYSVMKPFAEVKGLSIGIVYSVQTFKEEQSSLVQFDLAGYHSCVDIIVATPGRMADHLRFTKGFDLSYLRYLVLDEADLLINTSGGEWIKNLEQTLKEHKLEDEGVMVGGLQTSGSFQFPKQPLQRLLFSATLTSDPERLQLVRLYRPKLYIAGMDDDKSPKFTRPSELTEAYAVVDDSVKPLAVHHLIKMRSLKKVLVFTNSIESTHKLAVLLRIMAPNLRVEDFSSEMYVQKRKKLVAKFISDEVDVLVSTDAMARGLDVPNVETVISYDVCSELTYIHRIGRTARAGKPGTAISLASGFKLRELKSMLPSNGKKVQDIPIPQEDLQPYEAMYLQAVAEMNKRTLFEKELKKQNMDKAIKGNMTQRPKRKKEIKAQIKRKFEKQFGHSEQTSKANPKFKKKGKMQWKKNGSKQTK